MLDWLQNAVIYLGSFVLVLSLVVFVHEFGHFRVGRWCGVAVKSFSIGLGGEWFGWTDKYGTRWKISKIPLGGFVSWIDDTDGSSTLPASEADQALSQAQARKLGHFRAMELWKRAATVAAGPVTNFIFAIFAFGLVAFALGRDLTDYSKVRSQIAEVLPDTAALDAGLRAGEIIESVDGAPIRGVANFVALVASHPGQNIELLLRQPDGSARGVTVTPRVVVNAGGQRTGSLGVRVATNAADLVFAPVGPIEAVQVGAARTWSTVAQTGAYIGAVFSGRESGDQIAGPLGIVTVSGQVASAALDLPNSNVWQRARMLALSLLSLAALLSVAVGIANLLPIPVLDGGHLLFYAIEAVRGGRPLPAVAQEWAYRAGFAVMASLFLFATWNDITRLFPGAR